MRTETLIRTMNGKCTGWRAGGPPGRRRAGKGRRRREPPWRSTEKELNPGTSENRRSSRRRPRSRHKSHRPRLISTVSSMTTTAESRNARRQ
ncbi:unnamed protein product, partial [Musa banksii]